MRKNTQKDGILLMKTLAVKGSLGNLGVCLSSVHPAALFENSLIQGSQRRPVSQTSGMWRRKSHDNTYQFSHSFTVSWLVTSQTFEVLKWPVEPFSQTRFHSYHIFIYNATLCVIFITFAVNCKTD